jgi:hypothetical protein
MQKFKQTLWHCNNALKFFLYHQTHAHSAAHFTLRKNLYMLDRDKTYEGIYYNEVENMFAGLLYLFQQIIQHVIC